MTAVVEQRQEACVEPRQRADAENDVQQQEGGRAERANQQRLDGQRRIDDAWIATNSAARPTASDTATTS